MFGIVRELSDGRVELRFERWFPHARDKVWRALTSPAELGGWFVDVLDYDRSRLTFEPGAELEFVAGGAGWDLGLKRLADALDL